MSNIFAMPGGMQQSTQEESQKIQSDQQTNKKLAYFTHRVYEENRKDLNKITGNMRGKLYSFKSDLLNKLNNDIRQMLYQCIAEIWQINRLQNPESAKHMINQACRMYQMGSMMEGCIFPRLQCEKKLFSELLPQIREQLIESTIALAQNKIIEEYRKETRDRVYKLYLKNSDKLDKLINKRLGLSKCNLGLKRAFGNEIMNSMTSLEQEIESCIIEISRELRDLARQWALWVKETYLPSRGIPTMEFTINM